MVEAKESDPTEVSRSWNIFFVIQKIRNAAMLSTLKTHAIIKEESRKKNNVKLIWWDKGEKREKRFITSSVQLIRDSYRD